MGILWLASYPKSGNTWLRAFLANYLIGADTPVALDALSRFCASEATRAFYARLSEAPLPEEAPGPVYALRPKVHALIAGKSARTVFVKTHCALTQVDGVATVTPEVTEGAIYVLRNPFDVAVSFAAHFGADLDETVAAFGDPDNQLLGDAQQVHQYLGRWSDHVAGWVDAPGLQPLVLRYEDMVAAPREAFGKVVGFLRLPLQPGRLDRAIRFSSFRSLAEQEAAGGFHERPETAERFFRGGEVGGWRRHLSESQARRLVRDHAAVLRRFGYLDKAGDLSV